MAIQRISSKWAKTKVLLQNEHISSHIPVTCKYSPDALVRMLNEFTLVFLKPDIGTYGRGVLCIEQIKPNIMDPHDKLLLNDDHQVHTTIYELRYATETQVITSINELHLRLKTHIHNGTYLIQQGIRLLRYNNCPFDLRILTQKSPNHQWITTGIIGRVAAPHKVITNHHSGGQCQTFETLMSPYKNTMEVFNLQQSLKKLGVSVAQQLQKKYPNIKELGLDIAIDNEDSFWILEVNTLPALFPFKKYISDKEVYQRIHRYAVSYGRFQKKVKYS
ncbi:YheC/YheD family protein [Paenibacillus sp. FA6]|uniref:YheC/YheD family protein n=1 Tax=Paenibacillus sp. FA6 TaxID=3413029 RepID=UPI003F6555CC